jgi:phosphoglycolate phosphatase
MRGIIEQISHIAARLGEEGPAFREAAEAAVKEIELAAAEGATILPGAAEALAELRRAGVAVALITRNCRGAAEMVLRELDSYEVLLTRDDVPDPKPDPDHVLRSLAAMGRSADRAVVVGDHTYDMQAGRAAGVRHCVAVRTGYTSDDSLREAGADDIINSLRELPAWLRARGEWPR